MVTLHIGDVALESLDREAFAGVLAAADTEGGPTAYPSLFGLAENDGAAVDPLALLDELGRLSATSAARPVAASVGRLRDDLLEAVAAAGEG